MEEEVLELLVMVEGALELLHLLGKVPSVLLVLLLHGGDLALGLIPLVIGLQQQCKMQ